MAAIDVFNKGMDALKFAQNPFGYATEKLFTPGQQSASPTVVRKKVPEQPSPYGDKLGPMDDYYTRHASSGGGYTGAPSVKKAPAQTYDEDKTNATLQGAIDIYNQMGRGGPTREMRDPSSYITVGGTDRRRESQISRGEGRDRGGYAGRGGSGGGYVSGPVPFSGQEPEFNAPQMGDLPTYQAPEYAPPEYDQGRETALRQQFMAPGLRNLRTQTQNAILSAKSLDNPASQAQFVREVLSGYGEGLENVSMGATTSAMQKAEREYARELNKYGVGYQAKTQQEMTNYEAQLQKAFADFEANMQSEMAKYNADLARWQSGYAPGGSFYDEGGEQKGIDKIAALGYMNYR